MEDDVVDIDKVQRKIKRDVEEFRRSIIGVAGSPPFHYTIGNHPNYPELLVFGLGLDDGTLILNVLSNLMVERRSGFRNGELIMLHPESRFPVMAMEVHPGEYDQVVKESCTVQASVYHGTELYQVTQIVVPDKQGVHGPLGGTPYGDVPFYGEPDDGWY